MRRQNLTILLLAASCMSYGVWTSAAAAPKVKRLYFHSGTGFFVNRDGYILTNEHVLKDCERITVSGAVPKQDVKLIASDKTYDLALLKAPKSGSGVAEFRIASQPVVKGERVVVIGYPGKATNTDQTVMREGIVQSTKGPPGKPHWLQLSDILEHGNSGGPLMDNTGNVVGVAVAKVELRTQMMVNGMPTDVKTKKTSAAITVSPVQDFLNARNIRYRESPSGVLLSDLQVNKVAHRFVVNVHCYYTPKEKL